MARRERVICLSAALAEGGTGVRFPLGTGDGEEKGFAVRHGGVVRAFVNRCPHRGTELDWQPGEFFEESGLYLVCATHGALFEPATGFCVAGPCSGAFLAGLGTREDDGRILLLNEPSPPKAPDEEP